MNIIFPTLFTLIVQFLTLFCFVLPNNEDRIALLAIKSRITHDPHGVLKSWNDSLSICEWHGVICGTKHLHRVVGLNLEDNGLVGTLSPYVGNLSFLYNIYLANNTLGGNIPPQIGNLLRLKSLALENNTFEGQIPANLSRCLNLQTLRLEGNRLTGIIPSQLGLLSNLEFLSLRKNKLMGDLLNTVVMNLTSLRQLSASINSFQGCIPHNIGVLKNLTYFGLGDNKISGTIPPSFYNLSKLQVLDLSLNQLHGTLPLDIGFRLPQLTIFHIGSNSFHGNLPASLSNLTQLVDLSVYSNNFTGKFLFSARNMPNLESFDVSFNYLGTGEVGDLNFLQTLVNCSQLQLLQFTSNNFSGILPHSLGNFSTNLMLLEFGQNQIYGSIPTGLFNLINLERLIMEENRLTGHLSPIIGTKLTKLNTFSCRKNYLHGPIPYSLGNLSRLSLLYMGYNNFEGTIPSSLGNCTNLLYVSLGQNNLVGTLPPRLFGASMIIRINLYQNRLQGLIPEGITQLRNLVRFDVSENALSGELPSGLGSCSSLVKLYMGGNHFSGPIPQSFKSLTSLNYLQLSHNRLSGLIPNFLANLSLMTLNLSYNEFEGEVPRIGIFANLSAVIVTGNSKLCGGISELHLPRCSKRESNRRGRLSVGVILIIAVASLIVGVSIVASVYFLLCTRRKSDKLSHTSLFNTEHFSRVSYAMLLKATDNFSETNLLGAGHFGSVYKGVLDIEGNTVVAIKVINLEMEAATKSFMAECETLRNIRHRNLLKIVTACSSTDFQGNDFKALVYEFMPNGNLQQWIHTDQHERTLSLLQRVNIAIYVACALDYLHNSYDVPIIHCDLKPSNILLDSDMVAHIGDFGLARFYFDTTANNSSSVAVKGTTGYVAPEYGLGSMVSKEGDIYSYGIVVIEMMTAKTPTGTMFGGGLDLHNYAKSALSEQLINMIDPRLLDDDASASIENKDQKSVGNNDSSKMMCLKSLIEIGVKCSVETPQDRMRIEDAIRELQLTRDMLLTNFVSPVQ